MRRRRRRRRLRKRRGRGLANDGDLEEGAQEGYEKGQGGHPVCHDNGREVPHTNIRGQASRQGGH